MTKQAIIDAIEEHLGKSYKKYYPDFYIGITSDIESRLFEAHNVPKKIIGISNDGQILKLMLVR